MLDVSHVSVPMTETLGDQCGRMLLQDLNDSMQSHLRLHFNNEEASDEQVCTGSSQPWLQ